MVAQTVAWLVVLKAASTADKKAGRLAVCSAEQRVVMMVACSAVRSDVKKAVPMVAWTAAKKAGQTAAAMVATLVGHLVE